RRRRSELRPNRHPHLFDFRSSDPHVRQRLNCFFTYDEITVDKRGSPSAPKRRKRIRNKRVEGVTGALLLDESGKKVIQHGMYRKNPAGFFEIEKPANEAPDSFVHKVPFFRPEAIDEQQILRHPLGLAGQKKIVKISK